LRGVGTGTGTGKGGHALGTLPIRAEESFEFVSFWRVRTPIQP